LAAAGRLSPARTHPIPPFNFSGPNFGQTVYVTVAIVGSTFAAEYVVEGDRVILKGAAAQRPFRLAADGSLQDGTGLRFVLR